MIRNRFISSYCHIKNNAISFNGDTLFSDKSSDFSGFVKSAAKYLNINYPKLYKMDNLSKLAFLGADMLLSEQKIQSDTALVFSNRASSLDTDRKHQASISDTNNYYPSPSVFVYTLPNICLGEISIKHQLHSENSFFVFEHFNAEHLYIHTEYLMMHNKAETVLCGWVDFDDKNYEAFLYLVSENGNIAHTVGEILRLYQTKL